MKNKLVIVLLSIIIIVLIWAIRCISHVHYYEYEKKKWEYNLYANEEYFEYVVHDMNSELILKDVSFIELYNDIKIIGKNKTILIEEIPDSELFAEALEKIKLLGINLIIPYDAEGWSFIKQFKNKESDTIIHEVGLYYSKQREKTNINHLHNEWFFRNTNYNMENKLYEFIYNVMKRIFNEHKGKH